MGKLMILLAFSLFSTTLLQAEARNDRLRGFANSSMWFAYNYFVPCRIKQKVNPAIIATSVAASLARDNNPPQNIYPTQNIYQAQSPPPQSYYIDYYPPENPSYSTDAYISNFNPVYERNVIYYGDSIP